jgi:hypothetical protein
LHFLATVAGAEDAIDAIFASAGEQAASLVVSADAEGSTALHTAAATPLPMACFQLAAQAPQACLQTRCSDGRTPIDLAVDQGSCESLNALLLACAGCQGSPAMEAMQHLLKAGAVPDTWAPSGMSSLMLAAAADSADGVRLLLDSGASLELQDALGRTALMWAAGSAAPKTLTVLLNAGACVATRDRRGKTAADYAEEYADAKAVLDAWVDELESRAEAAQEALLAELTAEEERRAASKANKKAKKKAARKKKRAAGNSADEQPCATRARDDVGAHAKTEQKEHVEDATVEARAAAEHHDDDRVRPTTPPTGAGNPSATYAPTTLQTLCPSSDDSPATTPTLQAPQRPASPEWCTVKSKGPFKGTCPLSSTTFTTRPTHAKDHHAFNADPSKFASQTVPVLARGACALPPSARQSHHRRQHSGGSVTSTSSIFSHDTDGSFQSGHRSDRCVLRRAAAASSGAATPPMVPANANASPWKAAVIMSRGPSMVDEDSVAEALQACHVANASPPIGKDTERNTWATIAAGTARHKASIFGTAKTAGCSLNAAAVQAKRDLSTEEGAVQGLAASPGATDAAQRSDFPPNVDLPHRSEIQAGDRNAFSHRLEDSVVTAAPLEENVAAMSPSEGEELRLLRSEAQRLRLQLAALELSHRQELAAVLQDAAKHEAAAVARVAHETRSECIVRFAGFLQNHGSVLASALPALVNNGPAGTNVSTTTGLSTANEVADNVVSSVPLQQSTLGAIHRDVSSADDMFSLANFLNNHNQPFKSADEEHDAASAALGFRPLKGILGQNMRSNTVSSSTCIPGQSQGAAAPSLFDGPLSVSPLSTSPFSYEVGDFLRDEFAGNHSAFLVPASEPETGVSASLWATGTEWGLSPPR